jgi:hypothetical protein
VARPKNWTLTDDFYYELHDFREVVLLNLCGNLERERKVKIYKYVYPETDISQSGLRDLRTMVARHVGKRLNGSNRRKKIKRVKNALLRLNEYVELYPLKHNIITVNEGIHNPHDSEKRRGLLMTPEPSFKYYILLNPVRTASLVTKFERLMDMSRNEFSDKSELFPAEFIDDVMKRGFGD